MSPTLSHRKGRWTLRQAELECPWNNCTTKNLAQSVPLWLTLWLSPHLYSPLPLSSLIFLSQLFSLCLIFLQNPPLLSSPPSIFLCYSYHQCGRGNSRKGVRLLLEIVFNNTCLLERSWEGWHGWRRDYWAGYRVLIVCEYRTFIMMRYEHAG